jgi:hypothetical protein
MLDQVLAEEPIIAAMRRAGGVGGFKDPWK